MAKGLAGLEIALVTALLVSVILPSSRGTPLVEVEVVISWESVTVAAPCLFLGAGVSLSAHHVKIRTRIKGSKRRDCFIMVNSIGDHSFVP